MRFWSAAASIFVAVSIAFITPSFAASSLDAWVQQQTLVSETKMKQNISPAGAAKGIVLASPQRQDPDYYFHWIRDSALVIDALITHETAKGAAGSWQNTFDDFLTLSKKLQKTPTLTGLGEPRFNTDATPYSGDWARPQDDGPALRVITQFHAFDQLQEASLRAEILASVAIDVQYILARWNEPCFDLWEEVRGRHFYTRRVQMAALDQALLHFDSSWPFSREQVATVRDQLKTALAKHWLADKGYYSVTRDRMDGAEKYKFTELDAAVILAVLHSKAQGGEFGLTDDRVLATAAALEDEFAKIYGINQQTRGSSPEAPAIGRYSDDIYFRGNPWYLTTAAFAEFHYKLAKVLQTENAFTVTAQNVPFLQHALRAVPGRKPSLRIGSNLFQTRKQRRSLLRALELRGDQFLQRLQRHTPADGGMAEQFDRNTAKPVSARDLTWSYASFLTAANARALLLPSTR